MLEKKKKMNARIDNCQFVPIFPLMFAHLTAKNGPIWLQREEGSVEWNGFVQCYDGIRTK